MIFVPHKSEEWHDEFKASLFRYFKHLSIDYKVVRNLNDCLFIQIPPSIDFSGYWGDSGHHENVVIRPEIEFFYKLCSINRKAPKFLSQIRIVLISTEEFKNILPKVEPPPCYTKIPFSMQEIINKRIADDASQCGDCKWGETLVRYRNILYHVNQINDVWNCANNEKNIINQINQYESEDFISSLNEIGNLLGEFFHVSKEKKEELKNLAVYILEDDPEDCQEIEKMLELQGITNRQPQGDPLKFINKIIQDKTYIEEKNTVFLLDLVMRNDDVQGEEICRKLNHFLPFVPALIISGKKDIHSFANKLVGLKFDAFFPKECLIDISDDSAIDKNIKELYSRIFISKILESIESVKRKKEDRTYIESMKKSNNKVGIVVAGYGNFSRRTFGNLLRLIKKMNDDNSKRMEFELLAIIEPYYECRLAAKERLKKENLNIPVVKNIDAVRLETFGYPGEIVIRDVSSSDEHANNHKKCKRKDGEEARNNKDFFHIVEKPIALSEKELNIYKESINEGIIFSSVLEEIENPAVLTVKEYIEENGLTIKNLEFWRYSSMAWTQLLERARLGVRGGSYMDKSIHDWAVTYFLLDAPQYKKDQIDGKIEMFMPYSCHNLLEDFPEIKFTKYKRKSTDKKKESTEKLKEAEDLKMSSTSKLIDSEGKTVVVRMHSSWGGVTKNDENEILNEGEFHLAGALYKKNSFGSVDFRRRRNVDYKFIEQELRLGKVECQRGEEKLMIYFNMLTRDNDGIYPFVKVIRDGALVNIPLCQRKGDHLHRVLENGFLYLSGIEQSPKIGPEMSIFCHKMALKCRAKAQKNIKEKSMEAVKKVQEHVYEGVGMKFYWD